MPLPSSFGRKQARLHGSASRRWRRELLHQERAICREWFVVVDVNRGDRRVAQGTAAASRIDQLHLECFIRPIEEVLANPDGEAFPSFTVREAEGSLRGNIVARSAVAADCRLID